VPDVFLERSFETPLTPDAVRAMGRSGAGCLDIHRVEWRSSLLATSGRRMICRFHAPDAESVRLALRATGADTERLWTGTVHDGPGLTEADHAASNVLIERTFPEPLPHSEVEKSEQEGWCLKAYHVAFVRTYVSADHRRLICLYRAPDAESVRMATRYMWMPADDVWAFTTIEPSGSVG
jgi:hypothetical protein